MSWNIIQNIFKKNGNKTHCGKNFLLWCIRGKKALERIEIFKYPRVPYVLSTLRKSYVTWKQGGKRSEKQQQGIKLDMTRFLKDEKDF